jgi:drug/metabolite transporter (DMT)-like permease
MGLGEALSLACALNWAFVLILFRRVGRSVHPFALNLIKNSVAFALFVPTIVAWHGWRIPDIAPIDYGRLLLSGFLGLAVAETLVFKSLNVLGAGLMAIVECLYSPFVILFSLVWLREKLSSVQGLAVLGSAIGAYVQMILWLGGLKYAQASIAAVANQTATIFTILLAAVILREPLTRFRIVAAALATAGVLLITLTPNR